MSKQPTTKELHAWCEVLIPRRASLSPLSECPEEGRTVVVTRKLLLVVTQGGDAETEQEIDLGLRHQLHAQVSPEGTMLRASVIAEDSNLALTTFTLRLPDLGVELTRAVQLMLQGQSDYLIGAACIARRKGSVQSPLFTQIHAPA
jgi:hypothetical protein